MCCSVASRSVCESSQYEVAEVQHRYRFEAVRLAAVVRRFAVKDLMSVQFGEARGALVLRLSQFPLLARERLQEAVNYSGPFVFCWDEGGLRVRL